MREMDLNTFVRSSMKAHQRGGDIVRIETCATFYWTVHGHSADANACSGKVLG